ncbi:hypothetical protein NFI96_026380, partial [Prochilodus magdalenae]
DLDGSALDSTQKDKLGSLLEDFRGLFAARLGHTTVAVHHIDTGDARPINLPPYRTSPLKKKLIEEQIQSMLDDGIIEPLRVHGQCQLSLFPSFQGKLDFVWTIGSESGDGWSGKRLQTKTAFVSHCGLFQFKVLPFGLCNAPAMFQRVMNTVLAGLIYKCCAVYLDDIVIASPTFKQHLLDLREVFLRLEKAGLTLKPGKCQFCWNELKFLGYKVSPDGILLDSDKIDAVLKFPVPTDVKQVRQFLGLTSYYRRFIHNYAQFDVRFVRKPGLKNTVPDALSRNPQQGSISPTYCPDMPLQRALVWHLSRWQSLLTKNNFAVCKGKIQLWLKLKDRWSCTNAAERVNRTLKAAIRAYVGDKHTTWDKYLSQICFALRTTPHESAGVSPAKMLYGRELSMPLDLLKKPFTDEKTPENTVQRIHDHARASRKSSHVRQKHHYDKIHRSVVYEPGDLVHLKSHSRSDAVANLTAKLAPVFSGPYKVVKKLSDVNYRLSGVDGTDMGVVHVVNLQPFRVRSTPHTESQSYLTSGTAASQDSSSSGVVDSLSPASCGEPELEIGEQEAVEGTHASDGPGYS